MNTDTDLSGTSTGNAPADPSGSRTSNASGTVSVIVHPDPDVLVASAAARLITHLVDVQSARGEAQLVITGGGPCIASLQAIAESAARDAVDWQAVDIWWGDERYLPKGDPDRNETQARQALLDQVPLDPNRVHPMPASDGPFGEDVEAAAAAYAEELKAGAAAQQGVMARAGHPEVPAFDVVLLGLGPDGHVASMFPGTSGPDETERTVIGVRNSPKPPPTRVSMTFPALRSSEEIWLVASGEGKAMVIGEAFRGVDLPCVSATGRRRTIWLLDRASAGRVPARFSE